jgi:hypothetical protein
MVRTEVECGMLGFGSGVERHQPSVVQPQDKVAPALPDRKGVVLTHRAPPGSVAETRPSLALIQSPLLRNWSQLSPEGLPLNSARNSPARALFSPRRITGK